MLFFILLYKSQKHFLLIVQRLLKKQLNELNIINGVLTDFLQFIVNYSIFVTQLIFYTFFRQVALEEKVYRMGSKCSYTLSFGNDIQNKQIFHQNVSLEENLKENEEQNTLSFNISTKITKFDFAHINKPILFSLGDLNKRKKQFQRVQSILEDKLAMNEDNNKNQKINSKSQLSIYMGQQNRMKLKSYISLKNSSPTIFYKFLQILHKSPNGKIYKASGISNKNLKAIKQITQFFDHGSLIMTLNELDHPNICRVYQIYKHNNSTFIVMEYMEGGSLQKMPSCYRYCKKYGKKQLSGYFDSIKVIFNQVLYALCYLHEKNIAHWNIQCKNILLINKFEAQNQILIKLIGIDHAAYSNYLHSTAQVSKENVSPVFTKSYYCGNDESDGFKIDILMLGFSIFEMIVGIKLCSQPSKLSAKDLQIVGKRMKSIWSKLQAQFSFKQAHFIDLILKMVCNKQSNRLSALECLQHPYFVSLDLNLDTQNIRSSENMLRMSTHNKQLGSLINYIQDLYVYKNITQRQMIGISQIFSTFDRQKNGTIQIQQLIDYFQSQSIKDKRDQNIFDFCIGLLDELDKDRSGTISYHEFCRALMKKQAHLTKQTIQQIFDHLDSDENGYIQMTELQSSFPECTVDQLEFYMKRIDENEDKIISKIQFVSYCMSKLQKKWRQKTKVQA